MPFETLSYVLHYIRSQWLVSYWAVKNTKLLSSSVCNKSHKLLQNFAHKKLKKSIFCAYREKESKLSQPNKTWLKHVLSGTLITQKKNTENAGLSYYECGEGNYRLHSKKE